MPLLIELNMRTRGAFTPQSHHSTQPSFVGRCFGAEDGDDVFDWDHEELVIWFEVDRDGIFGVEENLVVLPQWHIFVVSDLAADGYYATGDRGDFGGVWQSDSAFGLAFGFVFPHEHSSPNGLDVLHWTAFLGHNQRLFLICLKALGFFDQDFAKLLDCSAYGKATRRNRAKTGANELKRSDLGRFAKRLIRSVSQRNEPPGSPSLEFLYTMLDSCS